ncbi:MAG TPA: hypothetical protein VMW17_06215 [Candidatus Binatia bacterium]|nr:hypothetical protein [Candidatus Binatia bacterium]
MTPSPTPVVNVCGGPITSLPQLCALSVMPNPVAQGGSITVHYGVSDLEGDIDQFCVSFAVAGSPPDFTCYELQPTGATINEFVDRGPIALPSVLGAGDYTLTLEVSDQVGHISADVATTFAIE